MKTKTVITIIGSICLMFLSTTMLAQDSNYSLISKELTKEQRALLQKEKEIMKANRVSFKASLTKQQLAILRDKTISKSEIRKRLVATFSKDQKNMIQNQQIRLRKTRENFRKTLTKDQRKILKERIDKIRKSKDRGELKGGPRSTSQDGKKRRPRN